MSAIHELSSAVRLRRSDMGITQAALAKLSGLSRATVSQVELGTIRDLSLTRAGRLLGVLGLTMSFSQPHSKRPFARSKTPALELAARTASVSYRETMPSKQLDRALTTGLAPAGFVPHLRTLLEEAPISLLAAVVEQLHLERGTERAQLWRHMRELARSMKTSRELWQ